MLRPTLTWALALAVGVSSFAAAQPQQRVVPEVRKLSITGVKAVDWHDLSRSISTRASKCRNLLIMPFCTFSHSPTVEDKYYLDENEVRRDMLRIRLYYWKRGYREATVDTVITRPKPKEAGVEFKVVEGPPTLIRKIAIAYDTTLINEKTRERITLLKAQDPLDLVLLDSMRVLYQNEAWDRGYGDGVVDTTVTVDPAARLADVFVKLTPNRRTTVGHVTVSGNSRVGVNTILRSLTFNTGDLYRQSDVLESQRNLYESNLFRLAMIDVPPQYDSVKNVTIDVSEAPLHDARVGPGISTIDFLQFQSHFTAYNLFGGGRRLDVNGTVGNLLAPSLAGKGLFRDVRGDVPFGDAAPFLQPTYTASIDFKQPAFLQRPADQAALGTFVHRTINPGVFIDQGFGGQVTVTHAVRPRAPVSLNYRYELNRVQASDVYFCAIFAVCDGPTINALSTAQALSPLTLTGFVDRSDLPFSPTKGYVARLDFEHASALTLSDFRYNRAFFDGAVYGHKSNTANVYSAHLRIGLVKSVSSGTDGGVLHPRKRFYAGGANSVRGYGEGQLGPKILAIDDTVLINGATSIGGGTCGFTVETVKFCNPNSPKLSNRDFASQPIGGRSLVEGSIEYRLALNLGETLRHFVVAFFIDGAIIDHADTRGLSTINTIVKGDRAITPGFGLRYNSPIGPVRVDFGINPNRAEDLLVVTALHDNKGNHLIVPLATTRRFSPGKTFLDHLVLHFSIGEAY